MNHSHALRAIGAVAMASMLWGCSAGEPLEPIAERREAVFLEAGSMVVMEAEHFTANVPQGTDSWVLDTNGSPSGGQALLASPDNGTAINTGYVTQSPRLDFEVSFSQTGTYHVWVRGRDSGASAGSGDSCHAGIDGAANTTADRISSFGSSFGWSKTTMDSSAAATINVGSTGLHTVNLWMREDGFVVDKILLTTNASFVPTGTGPDESAQQNGCTPSTYEAESMFHSTGGSTTGGWNIWSNGYISTNHTFTAGSTTITVTAQGTVAAGVWPHMIVRVGGVQVGATTVNSTSWTTYPFSFTANAGTQEVRVEFDNDFNQGGEDRNLLVDKVIVSCGGGGGPTCSDSTQNGNETDVDCGGGTCGPCANGDSCLVNSDCTSGNCSGGTCQAGGGTPPYKDPSLPIATRRADLLGRMTLDEKIGQMTQGEQGQTSTGQTQSLFLGSILSGGDSWPGSQTANDWVNLVNGHQQAALATRLGIPIIYGIDAVHGQAKVQGATVFPHNIGIGATRDAALAQEIGVITAREMLLSGIPWTFAPALAVARDQRWGRTYESYGEDPALASLLSATIAGLQGTSLASNVLATAKHFVADGGAMWGTGVSGPIDRGNAELNDAALRAIHLSPYLSALGSPQRVGSVMVSFSSVNGTKMHANQQLVTGVLKGELGFAGFVVSDWLAINELPGTFNEQVRASVNAGLDMFMMPGSFQNFINTLRTEVNAGNVSQARIDDAVSRILTKKFELGLFEVPFVNQRASGTVGAASHRAVARQAVRQSLVLLKNEGGILPLSTSTSVCVNGNGANNLTAQLGAWTLGWQGPQTTLSGATTILTGIDQVANVVASGCQVGIRVMAESPQSYAEWFGDNANPSHDNSGSCVGTQGCVVVLLGGRPMNIQSLVGDPNTRAIVMAWYPGSEGAGVADVLFGVGGANFTGKLPVTWKIDSVDTPVNYCDPNGPNTNGNSTPDACEDTGDHYSNPASPPTSVLFPYGFGLSYGAGPTCTDGTKNGNETDIDCGGGTCPDCADGRICSVNGDCTGNSCVSGICCSVLAAPTGLSALPGDAQVSLSWSAVSGSESYNVKRSTTSGSGYVTVGTSTAASHVDGMLTNGTTYYYVVSAVNACGAVSTESVNSTQVSATPNASGSDLVAHYRFDETSGTIAFDSSGNGRNATLQNGATFVAGYAGNAVRIAGGSQRVSLPTGIVQSCTDLTMALRVNLVSNSSNWARIFDLGSGTGTNMFLTPRAGASNVLRFALRLNNGTEQRISWTFTFPTAQWRHVAVTLSGNTGTLYVDGLQRAQNTSLTNNPSQMGATANNWLGDSQYSADPALNAILDDFRISCRAYSASEIQGIANQ